MTRVNKNNHIQNKQRFMASRLNNKLGRYALLSLLAFGSVSAYGQEANEETEKDESDVERIVVTVERRSQDIQDLGGTAFAFSGEELKSQGIQDITDIAESIPGLEIGNNQVFKQDMVDPDVIEHDLVGKDTAPDIHAVIRVVDDDVASHQRTAVLRCVGAEQADMAGRAAQVIANVMGKRIDPDGQGLSGVIADNIVQQYRLATSYQNRSRDIRLAADAIRIDVVDVFDAVVVVFN